MTTTMLPRPAAAARVPSQLLRFGAIGVLSTVAYLLLFALLRPAAGAQAANFAALLVTAVGNTALNRRLTFAVRGAAKAVRHQAQGLLLFALGLALTAGSLLLLDAAAPGHAHVLEVAVLVAANLTATVLRFVLMRVWVFRTAPVPTETLVDLPTIQRSSCG